MQFLFSKIYFHINYFLKKKILGKYYNNFIIKIKNSEILNYNYNNIILVFNQYKLVYFLIFIIKNIIKIIIMKYNHNYITNSPAANT